MKGRKPKNRLLRLFLCMILVLAMAGSSLSALASETGGAAGNTAQTLSLEDETAPGDSIAADDTEAPASGGLESGTGESQSQEGQSSETDSPGTAESGSSESQETSDPSAGESTSESADPSESEAVTESDSETVAETDESTGESMESESEAMEADNALPSPLSVLLNTPNTTRVPDHHKYIKANSDGTYTLTLNVKGLYESETGEKPKMDVLLIVDQSDSMNDYWGYYTTRLQALKNVVSGQDGLTQAILGNENIDARMAIVGYSGSTGNRWGDTPYNDAATLQNWTDSKSQIDSVINGLGAGNNCATGSGTNCEAGLRQGAQVLGSSETRPDAQKIVIFLSDGDPTYYYYPTSNWWHEAGETAGNGSSYDSTAASYAYTQAASISGLFAFYTVGISSSANGSFLRTLADRSTAQQKGYYGSSNSGDLADAFEKIVADIIEFTCRNVTITDTLSQYVDLYNADPGSISLTITRNDNGQEVPLSEEAVKGLDFQTTISGDGKKISASLGANYTLNQDYTYSISFNVVPSQQAYDEFAANQTNSTYPDNGNYPHTGSPNSDALGNTTSSNQPGFYSNDAATLTYTYGDTGASSNTVNYEEQPVVQVSSMSITVNKLWENDDPSMRPDSITVNLYQDGSSEIYKTLEITPGENGNWTGVFQYVAKGHTYTVQESAIENYTSSVSGDAENGFTITNRRSTADITVTKNWVDNNNADQARPASISVQLMNGDTPVGGVVEIGLDALGHPLDGTVVSGDGNQWTYTWADLPILGAGQPYTVQELTEIDGYTTTYSEDGLTIINTRQASLTVGKKVTGAMGDKTAAFDIIITLKNTDGTPVEGTQSYAYIGKTLPDVSDANEAPQNGTITFTDGVGTIRLSHGQSITIQGLPTGITYEVSENDPQGHTVTYEQGKGTTVNSNTTAVVINNRDKVPVTGFTDNPAGGTLLAGMALFIGVGVVGLCTFFSRRTSRRR